MEIEKRETEGKTLYVCVNNVGRSQFGAVLHNHTEGRIGEADSAGIKVDIPGGKVKDWVGGAADICTVMEEEGLDISGNTRTQFSEDMAQGYDRIIFMLDPEQIPDDLEIHSPNRHYWQLRDPRDMPIERVRDIKEFIKANVGLIATSHAVDLLPCYS
ncbi:MAG: low molecular weight phosphatase family protein [Candidatus Saccharimonadales bacterium]